MNLQNFINAKVEEGIRIYRWLLEDMAAAYLLKTDIPPDEVMLCEQLVVENGKSVMRYWYQRRDDKAVVQG